MELSAGLGVGYLSSLALDPDGYPGRDPLNEYRVARPVASVDYGALRILAHSLAEEDASGAIPPILVRVTDIDSKALSAYTTTWKGRHPTGYGGFDWVQLWHRLCRHDRRSFHCALWHQSVLCGLAIGTVPRGHSVLTLRCMEGRPNGHPLQGHVARIVLAAAEYYAAGLSVPQIRIENPAPGVEALYRGLGFTLASREGAVRYLVMDLPYGRS